MPAARPLRDGAGEHALERVAVYLDEPQRSRIREEALDVLAENRLSGWNILVEAHRSGVDERDLCLGERCPRDVREPVPEPGLIAANHGGGRDEIRLTHP